MRFLNVMCVAICTHYKPRPSDADKYRPSEGRSKLREYVLTIFLITKKATLNPSKRYGKSRFDGARLITNEHRDSNYHHHSHRAAWRWRRLLVFKTQVKRKSLRPLIGTDSMSGRQSCRSVASLTEESRLFALTPLPPQILRLH